MKTVPRAPPPWVAARTGTAAFARPLAQHMVGRVRATLIAMVCALLWAESMMTAKGYAHLNSCEREDASESGDAADKPRQRTNTSSGEPSQSNCAGPVTASTEKIVLGRHSAPAAEVERASIHDLPDKSYFLNEYVYQRRRPVVLEGAAWDMGWEADRWTDEQLLLCCSSDMLSVDTALQDTRQSVNTDIRMSEFIAEYRKRERPWHLIDSTPEHLARQLHIPRVLDFREVKNAFMDSLLWMNAGGGSSLLHHDYVEGLMCVTSGTKEVMLVDPAHAHSIPIDRPEGDWCNVNVSDVDPHVYGNVLSTPWISATVNTGDCIYLPAFHIHYIHSVNRTIGINFWWVPHYYSSEASIQQSALRGALNPTYSTMLSNLKSHPVRMLHWLLSELLRQITSIKINELEKCVVHEHDSSEIILAGAELFRLDTNKDGLIDREEWDADMSLLRDFFISKRRKTGEELEAGAIYIRCRPIDYHLQTFTPKSA